ncbi:nucleotidyltransferase family protein [Caldilinea sp.]|uniref:nucleotidyltransferase family protein n=1 Tax=Caldilinea sp. TaxID=2293560 RepID=UPI002BBB4E62|nr:nucleotidyltransferase family protein [Anaerolineales bacterium]HQY92129.1 nucleotidyltransferase family protein [Caldilinea sp.]HRA65086.1 nucleotidyltransferase family protein [Caldilinea sp.]
MLTKETIVHRLQESYPYLMTEYGVKRIGLFGSFASGTANEASDIDVIVEFQRPIGFKFIELVDYLERLLGREVDVLTPVGVQGIRVSEVASKITASVVYV